MFFKDKSIRLKSFLMILFFFATIFVAGCSESSKIYHLRSCTDGRITLDGKIEEKVWHNTDCDSSFVFPWQVETPPKTMFRAFYDEDFLFFSFSVEDRDLVYDRSGNDEMVLTGEDRIEIYFAKDRKLKDYYCIEIDPLGRVLDYSAKYYRNFDVNWNWNGLKTAAVITDQGYDVEAMIPLKSLSGFIEKGKLSVGLYRAELSRGDKDTLVEEWISWVDPKTKEPDFHTPSSFGCFVFEPAFPNKFVLSK